MTRPGKMAGVLALLAALLLGSPALSRDPEDRKTTEDLIRDLRAAVQKLQKQRDLDAKMTNTELELLNVRLDRIERSLERLRSDPRTAARQSFSIDPERPPTSYGSIRLDNRLDVTAFVTIDGRTYSVPALGTRTLRDRPTGTTVYSVTADSFRGATMNRTRVYPNETLVLRIGDPEER